MLGEELLDVAPANRPAQATFDGKLNLFASHGSVVALREDPVDCLGYFAGSWFDGFRLF